MKTPTLTLFGRNIPIYGILFMIGLLLGAVLGAIRCKRRNIPRMEAVVAACFTAIGGILGAKLLSVLTSIDVIRANHLSFWEVMRNGFVFYGGLIGGAIGMFLYCKIYKADTLAYFDVFAVSVPIGHSLGRVGCFLTGCCFGMEYDGPLSVVYKEAADHNVPLNTPLLPIQLIEAFCLVVLYVVLEITYFKTKKKGLCTSIYFLTYAVMRFTLEFLRGDKVRGIHAGLSTSQWISLGIVIAWAVIFALYVWNKRKASSAPLAPQSADGASAGEQSAEQKEQNHPSGN